MMILPLEEQVGSREGGKTPAEENDQGRKLVVALRERKKLSDPSPIPVYPEYSRSSDEEIR